MTMVTQAAKGYAVDLGKSKFNSLLVLPTGGGKTMTAVYWLLKEVINKNFKTNKSIGFIK